MLNQVLDSSVSNQIYIPDGVKLIVIDDDQHPNFVQFARLVLEEISNVEFRSWQDLTLPSYIAESLVARTTYGLTHDSQLVACGQISKSSSYCAHIDNIASHPDYRNRGFASLILKVLEDDARNNGLDYAELLSLHTSISFYKKNGYTIDDPLNNLMFKFLN
jgi:GNAT superfamily N-acetyltransferase